MSDDALRYIRIVNETGDSQGTKVFDARTGEEIHGVVSVTTDIEVDDAVRATMRFVGVVQDVIGGGTFEMQHPSTGEWKAIKAIVFADGECWPERPIADVTDLGSEAREYRLGA